MAHLPTDIVFDETIDKGALSKYKVLFLYKITHLPQSVYERIVNFSKNGGTVVCSSQLAQMIPGAISFNMKLKKRAYYAYPYTINGKGGTADVILKEQLKNARNVKNIVANKINLYADCDSPRTFLNLLEKNGVKYLFVINDKRSFGDYVGKKYRVCMEQGIPQKVTISLKQENCVVYDLVSHQQLKCVKKNGKTFVNLTLKPVWGALLAIYPIPIEKVDIAIPSGFTSGKPACFTVRILDESMHRMPGSQPLKVTFTDANGKRNEFSNYYTTNNGEAKIEFIPAENDAPGEWEIEVVELSSGKLTKKLFSLRDSF
jgi:hypothetical protein